MVRPIFLLCAYWIENIIRKPGFTLQSIEFFGSVVYN